MSVHLTQLLKTEENTDFPVRMENIIPKGSISEKRENKEEYYGKVDFVLCC